MKRTFTKKPIPMFLTSIRISQRDKELSVSAAALQGVSQAEFLRMAIREHAQRVLADRSMQQERRA